MKKKLTKPFGLYLSILFSVLFIQKNHAQCFEIESILVDACATSSTQEGFNEMVRFKVGNAPLNVNDLTVVWPSGSGTPWHGLIQDANTAAIVSQFQSDVNSNGGCGKILEPTGGIIPANAIVFLLTSYNIEISQNSFGPLIEDIYIIFQDNATTSGGHFGNFGSPAIRTLTMNFNSCSDTVDYDRSLLLNQSGNKGAGDGAVVEYTPSGMATYANYYNNGCTAPVPTLNVKAGSASSGCPGATVALSGTAENYKTVKWTVPSGLGTFSNDTNLSTNFIISGSASGTITITLTATDNCGNNLTDTLNVTVTAGTTPTFTTISAICSGTILSALPTTSTNGISGSWSPALDNTKTTTYTFTPTAGQCAANATMAITVNPSTTPTFTQVAAICSGTSLSALPTTSTNNITGSWSPTLDNTKTTTYTFTPTAGQCAANVTMAITVNPSTTPTFTKVAAICSGATLSALPTISTNGITGTWAPALDNTKTTTYTFTPTAGQCAGNATMTITVNPSTTPTFTQVAAICEGATLSPLPTTSTNGINGSWSPALDNTKTTTYTFTPTAGQCAGNANMTITVNPSTTPTFTQIAAICEGATLPALSTTSNNGITGSWLPAVDNTKTTTYTFTPTAGQCAANATMTITVNPSTTPTFTQIAAICEGATLPALSTTSNNGITGYWAPNLDNTKTTTYTFTPTTGQCAANATMTITVNPSETPTFNQVVAICSGATLSALPSTSNNSITGTWSPALDNTKTTTYTFTPTTGQCASSVQMTIAVNQSGTVPLFNTINPICENAVIQPLPNTSINNISGTWSPQNIDNTKTTTYTFTPTNGQCAISTTLEIVVNPNINPVFNPITSICAGDTLLPLPNTSINGITGSWVPLLDNTKTTTYTFTPQAGICASNTSLQIMVKPSGIIPTFKQVAPICSGAILSDLSSTSENGITGSWSPAINNLATTTYTFTCDADQCAVNTTLNITVNPSTIPSFKPIAAICSGTNLSDLPITSENGITGTWLPKINNLQTTEYIFTPSPTICATVAKLTIVVQDRENPIFDLIPTICEGEVILPLPNTSNNGINGTWTPKINNLNTTIYTFKPEATACANTTILTLTVNKKSTPIFNSIAPICEGSSSTPLEVTSTNGISGTWSPNFNNTQTTIYTFTPEVGNCAKTTSLNIEIIKKKTPVFSSIKPICQGTLLADLPLKSNNSISGTWLPALDNTQTTEYTFTPNSNECALERKLTIEVTPKTDPSFSQVAPICEGASMNPLPTTSLNYVKGAWSPTFKNTTTTVYTFTPNNGICANQKEMTIEIIPKETPIFTAISSICEGTVLNDFPTKSTNGINGTWFPKPNNLKTTTYTFYPESKVCATTSSMTVIITPKTYPTFLPISQKCQDATIDPLPTTSTNGITGSWSPEIDSTKTTTYTFTPNATECATTSKLSISIIQNETIAKNYAICINDAGETKNPVTIETGLSKTKYSFKWSLDGKLLANTNPNYVAKSSGIYIIQATNLSSGCITNTISATVKAVSAAAASLEVNSDFENQQQIIVSASGGTGNYQYKLDDGSYQESNIFTVSEGGNYTVYVKDGSACNEFVLKADVINFPRYFTPNGDGIHDFWNVSGMSSTEKSATIYIYDRYGSLVKQLISTGNGWDGTFNGNQLPGSDYWFTIQYKDNLGNTKEYKSHFTLKR